MLARRLDPEVYEAFLEVVAAVQAAKSPQDLRALKSLHYEKLKGDRKADRSLRLHKGYRLIVREQRDADGIYCVFRRKPNTDSAPSRTLIPEQAEQRFRRQAEHFPGRTAESPRL